MCTNFTLINQQHGCGVISGRTLDFHSYFKTDVCFIPRGQPFPLNLPEKGIRWTNLYGFIGMGTYPGPQGSPITSYADGLNEWGLSAAALWIPGTVYPHPAPNHYGVIYSTDVVGWVLGNCRTVDEAYNGLRRLCVIDIKSISDKIKSPPLHYVITDAQGKHLIVEFEQGEMKLYSSENGVLTNAPFYPWHKTNMNNYEQLSLVNRPQKYYGYEINGSGLVGLPGDPTPVSRFVRTTQLVKTAYKAKTTQECVGMAFGVLQQLTVPRGIVLSADDPTGDDYTQWVMVRDHTRRAVYFCSVFNQTPQGIHLDRIRFDQLQPKRVSVEFPDWYQDITSFF